MSTKNSKLLQFTPISKRANFRVLHHSMFSPLLDDSCLSFHASFVYANIFWFGSVGYTSFKLSMVLSLKFGCNNHIPIGFLI